MTPDEILTECARAGGSLTLADGSLKGRAKGNGEVIDMLQWRIAAFARLVWIMSGGKGEGEEGDF
jgi:hypothetical protein